MQTKKKQLALLTQIDSNPSEALKALDLVYMNDSELSILRKKFKDDFIYTHGEKKIQKKKDLERIKALVIPPAWEDVRISHIENGHLQATGRDAKLRKQYRYHSLWNKIKNQTKFLKMGEFGVALPSIRARVEKDMKQKQWHKEKVIALIVKLMEETHIRIGNDYYAKNNKSYGLTTLRDKHVHVFKDKLRFEFVGKKGKEHKVTLKNKKLIKLVTQCEDIPGWELFQFYDESGNKHRITSSMVNEYLHDITGLHFTAKYFRTWAASVVFLETLTHLDPPENGKQRKENLLVGFDASAKALGNTRNVCRKYYVHPVLVQSYEQGKLLSQVDKLKKSHGSTAHFTRTEHCFLKLAQSFTPTLEV